MIIFLVEMSDAGMNLPPPLPTGSGAGDVTCVPAPPPPAQTEDELRVKYMDDMTCAESIRLDTQR